MVEVPTTDKPSTERPTGSGGPPVDFRVGYTINLNLPETTNVEVFNAIFRSLRENLLGRQ